MEVLREETQEAMAGPLSPLTLGPALVDLAAHVATGAGLCRRNGGGGGAAGL